MRIISTFTDRTISLVTGTPDEQRQAQREWQTAEVHRAIVSTKEELRRTDLLFERLPATNVVLRVLHERDDTVAEEQEED